MPLPLRIIFAGGGTGGHLFPAIAIADEIKKLEPTTSILFVGTRDKIEARVVPGRGYSFRSIWISGFQRGMRFTNLLFPVKVIVSMMQAMTILKEFKPHAVVGTGGYVAGPVLRAAMAADVVERPQHAIVTAGELVVAVVGRLLVVPPHPDSKSTSIRRKQNCFTIVPPVSEVSLAPPDEK